jgi:hypothetical protein
MIEKRRDHIEGVAQRKLNKIRLGDDVVIEANGPVVVIVPGLPAEQATQLLWVFMLTLAHNKLLGQEPVISSLAAPGAVLTDLQVEKVVETLLEQAREYRDKQNREAMTSPGGQFSASLRENPIPLG